MKLERAGWLEKCTRGTIIGLIQRIHCGRTLNFDIDLIWAPSEIIETDLIEKPARLSGVANNACCYIAAPTLVGLTSINTTLCTASTSQQMQICFMCCTCCSLQSSSKKRMLLALNPNKARVSFAVCARSFDQLFCETSLNFRRKKLWRTPLKFRRIRNGSQSPMSSFLFRVRSTCNQSLISEEGW